MNRDQAVEELIRWHFEVDPKTREIYRFIAANEDQPEEPIKLLEINDATPETGRVDAFGFGPAADFPYPSVIAQVTPRELDHIRAGEMQLPDAWNLSTAQVFHNGSDSHAQAR